MPYKQNNITTITDCMCVVKSDGTVAPSPSTFLIRLSILQWKEWLFKRGAALVDKLAVFI
jgi:hypothetical protein